ncbi:hypothetical protein LCGC14_2260810 [marine sediment metagenome]|uniref:Uncharacterized protein n=1 Tax=marine sediment metagenome TaxID=412755 RepID=A0A0F9CZS0_9ZZZZ
MADIPERGENRIDLPLEIKWPAEFKVEPQCFPFILAFQDTSHTTVAVPWALRQWLDGDDEYLGGGD